MAHALHSYSRACAQPRGSQPTEAPGAGQCPPAPARTAGCGQERKRGLSSSSFWGFQRASHPGHRRGTVWALRLPAPHPAHEARGQEGEGEQAGAGPPLCAGSGGREGVHKQLLATTLPHPPPLLSKAQLGRPCPLPPPPSSSSQQELGKFSPRGFCHSQETRHWAPPEGPTVNTPSRELPSQTPGNPQLPPCLRSRPVTEGGWSAPK